MSGSSDTQRRRTTGGGGGGDGGGETVPHKKPLDPKAASFVARANTPQTYAGQNAGHDTNDEQENQARQIMKKLKVTASDSERKQDQKETEQSAGDSVCAVVTTSGSDVTSSASAQQAAMPSSEPPHHVHPTAPPLVPLPASLGGVAGPPSLGQMGWDLLQKHPLQSAWTMWYLRSEKGKEWEECLKEVSTFDTVEDWWALYNHVQEPSSLTMSSDYYIFKKGIKPMWEDSGNNHGGRWVFSIDRAVRDKLLDHFWLELTMSMIGEQFGGMGELICGAVINVRTKGDKIALWTRDAVMDDENRKIGQILKQKLNITDVIKYEMHHDCQSKRTSNPIRPRLTV